MRRDELIITYTEEFYQTPGAQCWVFNPEDATRHGSICGKCKHKCTDPQGNYISEYMYRDFGFISRD